jgi:hypothetical protein
MDRYGETCHRQRVTQWVRSHEIRRLDIPSLPWNFAPITLAVRGSPMMVANAILPVRTLGEFINLAKAKPGQMHRSLCNLCGGLQQLGDQPRQ